MLGIEHALKNLGRFVCPLADKRFLRLPIHCFQTRRKFVLQRDRLLVTTFHSPLTVPSFKGSVPGSSLLACYFAHSACSFHCPFGLTAPQPVHRFAPVRTVSSLQTRCSFDCLLLPPLCLFSLLFGILTSLWIIASTNSAAVRSAFRNRPISSHSPLPFRQIGLRIIVPGSLLFRRLCCSAEKSLGRPVSPLPDIRFFRLSVHCFETHRKNSSPGPFAGSGLSLA